MSYQGTLDSTLDSMLSMCYNTYMDNKEKYAHIRVLRTTQKNLRIAAALAGKSGLELLDGLVRRELDRLQKERGIHAENI